MRKYIYGAMYLVFIICHPNVAFFMEIKKKKGYGIYEIGCLFLVKVVHQ